MTIPFFICFGAFFFFSFLLFVWCICRGAFVSHCFCWPQHFFVHRFHSFGIHSTNNKWFRLHRQSEASTNSIGYCVQQHMQRAQPHAATSPPPPPSPSATTTVIILSSRETVSLGKKSAFYHANQLLCVAVVIAQVETQNYKQKHNALMITKLWTRIGDSYVGEPYRLILST